MDIRTWGPPQEVIPHHIRLTPARQTPTSRLPAVRKRKAGLAVFSKYEPTSSCGLFGNAVGGSGCRGLYLPLEQVSSPLLGVGVPDKTQTAKTMEGKPTHLTPPGHIKAKRF